MSIQLNRAELIGSLRKVFGFRGATNLEVSESIIPGVNLGDLDNAPFHTKRGGIWNQTSGPVAAQFSYVGLRVGLANAPMGFVAVVRAVKNMSGQGILVYPATTFFLDTTLGGPAVGAIGRSWDTIENAQTEADRPRPSVLSYQRDVATAYPTDGAIFLEQNAVWNQPFCIRSGNTLVCQGLVLNTATNCCFYWDEYNLG